jgi:hypothetical protein
MHQPIGKMHQPIGNLPLCPALTVAEALDGLSATHISRSPPPVGALELSRESGGGPLEYLGMML